MKITATNASASANKMDDIEEYYSEEIQKEDEDFLKETNQKEKIENIEKEYKKKRKELRKKYEKEYLKKLENEKKIEIEKIKKKAKTKKKDFFEVYKAESIELKFNWRERFILKIQIIKYNFGRKIRNLYEKIIPKKLIYLNHKIKKNFFQTIKNTNEFFEKTLYLISMELKLFFKFVKEFSNKVGQWIKTIFIKISSKLKKEKKNIKENKNGNQEKPNSESAGTEGTTEQN